MSKKIAAYMRISVDTEKDRDNTSIENQRRIIRTYVKQTFPDAMVDYYEDRDKSGYTFEQREDYQRMRPLLMDGTYDILIIKDFSRFSRRNSRGLVELEDLRDAGVRIISIGDGIDYPTYDDWNNIQVRFLLNEMPVTDASKRLGELWRAAKTMPIGFVLFHTDIILLIRKIWCLRWMSRQQWWFVKSSVCTIKDGDIRK